MRRRKFCWDPGSAESCCWALFYHLCNGIRHLFWDVGLGFELKTAYASGIAVVIVSVVMTVIAWGLAYAMRGGI